MIFQAWLFYALAAAICAALMPLVQDPVTLALVCAPFFLVMGCFMARPATGLQGMALLLGVVPVPYDRARGGHKPPQVAVVVE